MKLIDLIKNKKANIKEVSDRYDIPIKNLKRWLIVGPTRIKGDF